MSQPSLKLHSAISCYLFLSQHPFIALSVQTLLYCTPIRSFIFSCLHITSFPPTFPVCTAQPRPLSMHICNTHDEMIPTYVRCDIGKVERLAWVTCHYEMGYRRVKCNLGLDWVLWLLSVPHGITLMVHAHQIQRRMSGLCILFIFYGEQEIGLCCMWWIWHVNLTDSAAVCEFAWWWLTLCKWGLSSTMQPDHKTQIRLSD